MRTEFDGRAAQAQTVFGEDSLTGHIVARGLSGQRDQTAVV
jgi:hypothetical protein